MKTTFRRRVIALAAAALVALGCPVAGAQALAPGATLESLIELARAGNPEFASMRLEAEAAAEKPASAAAFPDPTLRVELMDITNAGMEAPPSLNPSKVGGAKYTVMQMLPWFGKRDAMRGVAEADAKAASSRADASWLEVAMKIKSAYAQYYLASESEKLTREVLDLMGRLETIAQSRYAGGLAVQQDAIRAQVELTTMRTDLVMQQGEKRRAAARLNALVGRPAGAPLAEPLRARALPPPARLVPAELQERVQSRNPAVAAEGARADSAAKMVELTNLNRYPDVTIGVAPTQSGSRISEWELMFEVSIPLQQGSRRAKEREARAMLQAASARREAALLAASGELGESLAGLESARLTESLAATSLLPQAELTFQSALAAYESGKVDFATLLDAQRQILRARQERLKAQAEGQMRLAEIERIIGEEL